MNYPTKRTYDYNSTTSAYEMCYPISHVDAIMTKNDESETLGTKLANIDNKISTIVLNSEILWKIKNTGEAIYSTPVLANLSTGVKALIYTSWDWYIYCRNAETGELIWRYATGAPCYGRCQAEDINGDGKIKIFGASHDGYIYCLSETGTLLWSFANLYTREGTGTVSTAGNYYLTDTTKNWDTKSFMRNTTSGTNASVSIISGTGNGQTLEISSVESNKIWFFNNWTTTPDATSTYKIIPKYESDIYYQHCGTLNQEGGIWYLYVTGFDGQLVKLKAIDGSLIYKFGTKESIEPFPYLVDINNDGIDEVLISCIDKHVYCLKATDGSTVWSQTFSEPLDAFLNVFDVDNDSNLEVLTGSRDNRVYVLNGQTGVIKSFSRDTQGDIDCKVYTNSSLSGVVCGSDSGYIYGYDKDCECTWAYKTLDATNTSMISGTLNNQLILIQGDQSGGLHFLDKNGKAIKVMYLRGGIEGTPCIEQYDNYFIIYLTTIEGWVYAIKLNE